MSLRSRRLGALCAAITWNKGRSFVASLLRPLERDRGLGRRRLLENFGVCCADCCLRRSGCPCSSLRRRLVAVLACMFGGKKRLLHLRALRCLIPRFGAVSLCFCLISCRLDGSFVLGGAILPCNSTVLALKNGNASPEIISVQGRKIPPGAIGRFVLCSCHGIILAMKQWRGVSFLAISDPVSSCKRAREGRENVCLLLPLMLMCICSFPPES